MKICVNCGREISDTDMFCPYCGARQPSPSTIQNTPMLQSQPSPTVSGPPYPQYTLIEQGKDEGIAAILALVGGIFGIWGLGHLYVGKIGRGIALLLLGLVLHGSFLLFGLLAVVAKPVGVLPPASGHATMITFSFIGIILWSVLVVIGFVWQVFDAYNLAKKYNQYLRTYQRAPW